MKLINSITGCVNLGKLSRQDVIKSVFSLLVGDVEVVQEDELLVCVRTPLFRLALSVLIRLLALPFLFPMTQ